MKETHSGGTSLGWLSNEFPLISTSSIQWFSTSSELEEQMQADMIVITELLFLIIYVHAYNL